MLLIRLEFFPVWPSAWRQNLSSLAELHANGSTL